MDPLAEKYPGISPYVFVANSPLMFIDPDGRKIVDSKGNIAVIVAVDGSIVYTDFATPDIIEVIDAMKITKVGQNRVYEMIKHSNEIYIEIQNESPVYADPTVSITSSFFKPGLSLMFGSHKHVEMSDKQEIKSIITIYKKSIEKAIEDKIEHYMDNNFTVYFEYFSIQEHIGATGTHEAVHGTDKNSSRYYNAREPEKLPKSEEKIYYEQLKNEENANKNKNESLVPKN